MQPQNWILEALQVPLGSCAQFLPCSHWDKLQHHLLICLILVRAAVGSQPPELKPSDAPLTAFFRDFQLVGEQNTPQPARTCQSQCTVHQVELVWFLLCGPWAMQLIGGRRESMCCWEVLLAFNKKICQSAFLNGSMWCGLSISTPSFPLVFSRI